MFDWQADSKDHNEFMRNITEDLFTDQVFVMTPKGDVIDLPQGSTPVDFAYRVHSKVGDHCVGAKANARMVPLTYQFKNGDVAEIITRPSANPSRDWLAFVKTSHAKSRIKAYFKKLNQADNAQRGHELLEKELTHQLEREPKAWGDDPRALLKNEPLRSVAPLFNMPSETELLASIGFGTISALSVLGKLKPAAPVSDEPTIQLGSRRSDDRKLRVMAGGERHGERAFPPFPLLPAHPRRRSDRAIPHAGAAWPCTAANVPTPASISSREAERCQPVEYVGGDAQVYQVFLLIECIDRRGLLADVTATFAENKTFITAVKTQSHRDKTATLEFAVEVRNTDHLQMIMQKVYALGDILGIHRATGGRDEPKLK